MQRAFFVAIAITLKHGYACHSLDTRQKSNFVFQNGACLVGELFPHPVKVFCTHLEPPNCHISNKSFFPMGENTLRAGKLPRGTMNNPFGCTWWQHCKKSLLTWLITQPLSQEPASSLVSVTMLSSSVFLRILAVCTAQKGSNRAKIQKITNTPKFDLLAYMAFGRL